jgi:acyl-CoA reductase-like NAD-dependent aldehyde dehydrogenase
VAEHVCTVRELVDGVEAVPADELAPELTDSDTGEVLHPQLASSPESLERAIAAAAAVHEDELWTGLPVAERAAALRRLMGELLSRAEDMARADSLDNGVPLTTTTAFLGGVPMLLEMGAAELEAGFGHEEKPSSSGACDQWRLPWGPAAVLLPWNAPAHMGIVRLADALVAGCPVILKPSEWAPHSTGPLAAAIQAAGLPAGLVQIVHGGREISQKLVEDRRIAAVSFTGGVPGGTAVAELCAKQLKPVDLELSGNNPAVVLPDADAVEVVTSLVPAALTLNGQYCSAARRLIVPADQLETYLATLEAVLGAVKVGATTDPETVLGPIAHPGHLHHLRTQLAEFESRGCEVRTLGKVPEGGGHFLAPTVVLADKAPELQTEVFGPVLVVRTYGTIDEAVAIANDHPYGLSGYVFGKDRDQARAVGRRLRAGLVRLNSPFGPPDAAPAGSVWGISGLGSFGLGEGTKAFTGLRFVG